MKNTYLIILVCFAQFVNAQVGINNTNPQASLDITASNVATPTNTDGILIPRIDNFPATNPTAAQDGMMVFVTGAGTPSKGFYYWDNTLSAWISVNGAKNTLDQAYDEGGAGAGKTITATDGAVTIAGEDGITVTGTFNSGDAIGVTGAGTRMFFNPRKAAFRTGTVNGTQWDNSNIGNYSFASGSNTIASAPLSTALGNSTQASGGSSLAIGISTQASGESATAMGNSTTASGINSFTSGFSTTAAANSSVAMGLNNQAPSWGEMTVGANATTYIANSTTSWSASDRIFTIGNGAGPSARSNALTIYKNGLLNINDAYNMPLTDGASNYIMQTNGAGQISFVDPTTVGTDNQDLSLSGNTLILTNDATSVDLSGYLDNTDNQDLTGATLTGTSLQIDIQNGTSTTVDLVGLQDGTGTDDQTIDTFSFNTATNVLTLEVENDGVPAQTVDLSSLASVFSNNGLNTDMGTVQLGGPLTEATTVTLGTNNLIFDINSGGDFRVNNQNAPVSGTQFTIDSGGTTFFGGNVQWHDGNASGTVLARLNNSGNDGFFRLYENGLETVSLETNTGYVFNELGYDRNFRVESNNRSSMLFVDGGQDRVGIGTGTPTNTLHVNGDAKITNLAGTNSRLVSSNSAGVLSNIADGTNGQLLTTNGTGAYSWVNSNTVGTDNQNLTGATLTGTSLQIDIQNGTSASVDLAGLQDGTGTDDQTIDTFSFNTATNVLTLEVENDGVAPQTVDLSTLQDGTGTDNQDLSLTANILSLTNDVTPVDLSGYLDNTDNQIVDNFALVGTTLGISLQNDGAPPVTVSLASLLDNTDDQDLSLTGDTLSLTNDATTVDLSSYLDNTDNQDLTGATLTGTSLQIDIQNGTSASVDLSPMLPPDVSTFAAAKILMSADQSFTGNGWDKIIFDTVNFDLTTNFNTANTRFNVTTAGIYRINASLHSKTVSNSTSSFGIAVYINGSLNKRVQMAHYGNGLIQRDISALINLSVSDKIEIYFYHTGGITIDSNGGKTSFEIERIR